MFVLPTFHRHCRSLARPVGLRTRRHCRSHARPSISAPAGTAEATLAPSVSAPCTAEPSLAPCRQCESRRLPSMGASPPGARPDLRQAKAPNTNPSCTSPSSFRTAVQNGKDGLMQVGLVLGARGWRRSGQALKGLGPNGCSPSCSYCRPSTGTAEALLALSISALAGPAAAMLAPSITVPAGTAEAALAPPISAPGTAEASLAPCRQCE